jgi:hypothetical protein
MEAENNQELLHFKHLKETVSGTIELNFKDPATFHTTVWESNAGALMLANMEPARLLHVPYFTQ